MNTNVVAIVLGIVEGLTEFLPVSSTGHLILAGESLGFTGELASTFQIVIQLGAIAAILLLYWRRFVALLDFSSGSSVASVGMAGIPGIAKIGICCLPAFVVGFLGREAIKARLFNSTSVAVALIVGALVMLWIERRKPNITTESVDNISLRQALTIGVIQCLALWPGFSRSGATLIGGLLIGVERKSAAEFSFLVAVPLLAAATVYELYKSIHFFTADYLTILAIGFIVSFVSAVFAVKAFLAILGRWTLRPFAYYRIVLGVIVLLLGS